jgi:hypothetical protein
MGEKNKKNAKKNAKKQNEKQQEKQNEKISLDNTKKDSTPTPNTKPSAQQINQIGQNNVTPKLNVTASSPNMFEGANFSKPFSPGFAQNFVRDFVQNSLQPVSRDSLYAKNAHLLSTQPQLVNPNNTNNGQPISHRLENLQTIQNYRQQHQLQQQAKSAGTMSNGKDSGGAQQSFFNAPQFGPKNQPNSFSTNGNNNYNNNNNSYTTPPPTTANAPLKKNTSAATTLVNIPQHSANSTKATQTLSQTLSQTTPSPQQPFFNEDDVAPAYILDGKAENVSFDDHMRSFIGKFDAVIIKQYPDTHINQPTYKMRESCLKVFPGFLPEINIWFNTYWFPPQVTTLPTIYEVQRMAELSVHPLDMTQYPLEYNLTNMIIRLSEAMRQHPHVVLWYIGLINVYLAIYCNENQYPSHLLGPLGILSNLARKLFEKLPLSLYHIGAFPSLFHPFPTPLRLMDIYQLYSTLSPYLTLLPSHTQYWISTLHGCLNLFHDPTRPRSTISIHHPVLKNVMVVLQEPPHFPGVKVPILLKNFFQYLVELGLLSDFVSTHILPHITSTLNEASDFSKPFVAHYQFHPLFIFTGLYVPNLPSLESISIALTTSLCLILENKNNLQHDVDDLTVRITYPLSILTTVMIPIQPLLSTFPIQLTIITQLHSIILDNLSLFLASPTFPILLYSILHYVMAVVKLSHTSSAAEPLIHFFLSYFMPLFSGQCRLLPYNSTLPSKIPQLNASFLNKLLPIQLLKQQYIVSGAYVQCLAKLGYRQKWISHSDFLPLVLETPAFEEINVPHSNCILFHIMDWLEITKNYDGIWDYQLLWELIDIYYVTRDAVTINVDDPENKITNAIGSCFEDLSFFISRLRPTPHGNSINTSPIVRIYHLIEMMLACTPGLSTELIYTFLLKNPAATFLTKVSDYRLESASTFESVVGEKLLSPIIRLLTSPQIPSHWIPDQEETNNFITKLVELGVYLNPTFANFIFSILTQENLDFFSSIFQANLSANDSISANIINSVLWSTKTITVTDQDDTNVDLPRPNPILTPLTPTQNDFTFDDHLTQAFPMLSSPTFGSAESKRILSEVCASGPIYDCIKAVLIKTNLFETAFNSTVLLNRQGSEYDDGNDLDDEGGFDYDIDDDSVGYGHIDEDDDIGNIGELLRPIVDAHDKLSLIDQESKEI